MHFKHLHHEIHRIAHIGWLRAAVLGANDGIISTASLLIGIASAHTSHNTILITGMAALIAGAMSMAAGEYISVKSQAETIEADIQREKFELQHDLPGELEELTAIYIKYGLERELAAQVATQMMEHDALKAHLRDELGITSTLTARPLQAAVFSGSSFAGGAALPLLVAFFTPTPHLVPIIFVSAIGCLAGLGAVAAKMGGARIGAGAIRVTLWGTLAMVITAAMGALLSVVH